jgi:hypothetical protein
LYNNTFILRDERWILQQLRLMVAAFSVPGRIEEEFPIAKRRRRKKEETVSKKELSREFLRVCLWTISLNVFFPETWKLEAVGFIEVYFSLPISLLFQKALVLISCEVHNKEVLIAYCNYTSSLPSTLLSESFFCKSHSLLFFSLLGRFLAKPIWKKRSRC